MNTHDEIIWQKKRTHLYPESSIPLTNSGSDEPCACGMTVDELQDMMEHAIKQPLELGDKKTYEIHKMRTGMVIRSWPWP